MVVFPELSLTGYEPGLAIELATDQDDSRFDDFQKISDTREITVGVGVPTKSGAGICISMVLFQPRQAKRTYSKTYLHPDEEAFFVAGQSSPELKVNGTHITLSICYEISVPEHLETALKSEPTIYVASVAKCVNGIGKALERLSGIAKTHSMAVLMSSSVGPSDGTICAGKSSVWNSQGTLLGQLNETSEGIIMLDTETQELFEETIDRH